MVMNSEVQGVYHEWMWEDAWNQTWGIFLFPKLQARGNEGSFSSWLEENLQVQTFPQNFKAENMIKSSIEILTLYEQVGTPTPWP